MNHTHMAVADKWWRETSCAQIPAQHQGELSAVVLANSVLWYWQSRQRKWPHGICTCTHALLIIVLTSERAKSWR